MVNERDRRRRCRGRGETARRSFVLMTHTLSLPPTETRPYRQPTRLLGSPSHNSSCAVVSAHLPLSKVNREIQAPQANKKSRPDGGFQGGDMGGFTKE